MSEPISATRTDLFDVIGTAITSNEFTTVTPTNVTKTVILSDNVILASDTPVDLGKGKFAEAMDSGTNLVSGMSNAVWFVQGSLKASSKGTNVTLKAVGIWKEGSSTFKGSVTTSKTK